MVRLQVSSIKLMAVDLLKLLFYENERQFFAYTRTDNEVSLILKHDAAGSFKEIANANVSPMNWRALSLCNDEEVSGGLVNKLLSLLATQHYSIFYLSTSTQDYILVNSDQLEEILFCLSEHLTIDVSVAVPYGTRDFQTSPAVSCENGRRRDLSIKNTEKHLTDGKVNASEVRLALLPEDFCLHSFSLEEMNHSMKPLVKVLLIEPIRQQFFSFAAVGDQISMIVSRESASLFKSYMDINLDYKWRAFKVLGDWGFSEIGLVNSLSSCITAAGIDSPLFLSTFSRDFIIVQSDLVEDAKNAFRQAGFNVSP